MGIYSQRLAVRCAYILAWLLRINGMGVIPVVPLALHVKASPAPPAGRALGACTYLLLPAESHTGDP